MAKKKQYRFMNEAEFKRIKSLFELGLSTSQLVAVTKRSTATLWVISKSVSFTDYQDKIREQVLRAKEVRQQGFIPAADEIPTPEEVEQAQAPLEVEHRQDDPNVSADIISTDVLLLRIAKAVERIASVYESTPKKGGLFR